MTTIKVKRSTGPYNINNYNLHVYAKKPVNKLWTLADMVRNMDQAKSIITSNPPGCALIVKNNDGGDFKYDIYTNETLLQSRYVEMRSGIKWV